MSHSLHASMFLTPVKPASSSSHSSSLSSSPLGWTDLPPNLTGTSFEEAVADEAGIEDEVFFGIVSEEEERQRERKRKAQLHQHRQAMQDASNPDLDDTLTLWDMDQDDTIEEIKLVHEEDEIQPPLQLAIRNNYSDLTPIHTPMKPMNHAVGVRTPTSASMLPSFTSLSAELSAFQGEEVLAVQLSEATLSPCLSPNPSINAVVAALPVPLSTPNPALPATREDSAPIPFTGATPTLHNPQGDTTPDAAIVNSTDLTNMPTEGINVLTQVRATIQKLKQNRSGGLLTSRMPKPQVYAATVTSTMASSLLLSTQSQPPAQRPVPSIPIASGIPMLSRIPVASLRPSSSASSSAPAPAPALASTTSQPVMFGSTSNVIASVPSVAVSVAAAPDIDASSSMIVAPSASAAVCDNFPSAPAADESPVTSSNTAPLLPISSSRSLSTLAQTKQLASPAPLHRKKNLSAGLQRTANIQAQVAALQQKGNQLQQTQLQTQLQSQPQLHLLSSQQQLLTPSTTAPSIQASTLVRPPAPVANNNGIPSSSVARPLNSLVSSSLPSAAPVPLVSSRRRGVVWRDEHLLPSGLGLTLEDVKIMTPPLTPEKETGGMLGSPARIPMPIQANAPLSLTASYAAYLTRTTTNGLAAANASASTSSLKLLPDLTKTPTKSCLKRNKLNVNPPIGPSSSSSSSSSSLSSSSSSSNFSTVGSTNFVGVGPGHYTIQRTGSSGALSGWTGTSASTTTVPPRANENEVALLRSVSTTAPPSSVVQSGARRVPNLVKANNLTATATTNSTMLTGQRAMRTLQPSATSNINANASVTSSSGPILKKPMANSFVNGPTLQTMGGKIR